MLGIRKFSSWWPAWVWRTHRMLYWSALQSGEGRLLEFVHDRLFHLRRDVSPGANDKHAGGVGVFERQAVNQMLHEFRVAPEHLPEGPACRPGRQRRLLSGLVSEVK